MYYFHSFIFPNFKISNQRRHSAKGLSKRDKPETTDYSNVSHKTISVSMSAVLCDSLESSVASDLPTVPPTSSLNSSYQTARIIFSRSTMYILREGRKNNHL